MVLDDGMSDVPPEKQLRYANVRAQIEDGDIFLFRGTILLSRIIEKYSHGNYSHCAIAAAWGDRKMLLQAELSGGVQAVPISVAAGTYKGRVDWYSLRPEVRAKIDVAALLREAKADLGLSYATSELLRVAAHNIFRAALPKDSVDPKALFCSEYVARCFRKAGLVFDASDVGTSPSQIAASDALQFQGVILHDPGIVPDRSSDDIVTQVS